jgi:uncharacterized membrane protein YbhN (UPF0104 family)
VEKGAAALRIGNGWVRARFEGFTRGRFRLVIHILGLILLALIVWLGGPEAWKEVSRGKPGPIVTAFLLTGIANMLSAVRLKLVAEAASPGIWLPWRRLYYLTMVANTAGLLLPRSVSTVAGKSVGLKTLGVSGRRSVSTVFVDNAFDLFLLMPLVLPGFLYLQGRIIGLWFGLLALGTCLVLAAFLWWILAGERLARLAIRLENPGRLRFLARFPIARGLRLLPERPTSLAVFGLTIGLNGILALRFYYVAMAVSLGYEWLLFMAVFPLTQLSLVFGGLGIFDASWFGVLVLGGIPEQAALTFVIAQRAYIFIYILVWTAISYLATFINPSHKNLERS